jgi:DNA repair exonuclease SbcCD ATPase subunit
MHKLNKEEANWLLAFELTDKFGINGTSEQNKAASNRRNAYRRDLLNCNPEKVQAHTTKIAESKSVEIFTKKKKIEGLKNEIDELVKRNQELAAAIHCIEAEKENYNKLPGYDMAIVDIGESLFFLSNFSGYLADNEDIRAYYHEQTFENIAAADAALHSLRSRLHEAVKKIRIAQTQAKRDQINE